jgi:hypothetical protein
MGAPLFLPRRGASRQPQQTPQVDWTNPLTKGLQFWQTGPQDGVFTNTNGATTVATQAGLAKRYTHSLNQYLSAPSGALQGTPFTLFALTQLVQIGLDQAVMSIGASTNDRHLLYVTASNAVALFSGSSTGNAQALGGAVGVNTTFTLAGRSSGSNNREVWLNGGKVATDTTNVAPAALNRIALGAYWVSGAPNASFALDGAIVLALAWNRALSDAELKSVSENPWQLFAAPQRMLPLSAASPIVLAASAASATASTAALATQVALAAASQAGTSPSSTLATQLALGAGAASATSAGAALATQIPLAADARAASSGSASLTVGAVWAASASTSSSAAASLTTAVSLGAAAQAPANAGVALSSAIGLTASAVSNASGAAALTTQVAVTAIAAASTSSAAALSTAVALAAVASSRSAGSAALTVVPVTVHLSAERTFVVPPQARLYQVPLENRCFIL